MAGCLSKCTTFRINSIGNAWLDIRDHYGPRVPTSSSIYTQDINEWNIWAVENGFDPVTDVQKFGDWLNWKCSIGTTNYGNLSSRIRNHIGISAIPCPFDLDNYDPNRSELWLGYIPTSLVSHDNHYMKVSLRGSSWGFQCTYSGCPYQEANGFPYFHV